MFVTVAPRKFTGPASAADLTQFLQLSKERAAVRKIESELAVRLAPNGKLAATFSLTRAAAKEYGSRIAKHFGTSLLDLVDSVEDRLEYGEIINAVNQLASLRYSRFKGYRWMFDTHDKHVIGLLSPRYRITWNHDFWSGIRATALKESDKPQLFTAIVNNRNLDLVMAGSDRVSIGDTTFVRGVLAQNAETSGRAVRAANVLICATDRQWACDNFYADTRIPHLRGRKFEAKMTQIYQRLRARRISSEDLRSGWAKAAETPVVKKNEDKGVAMQRLVSFLKVRGLTHQDAHAVATEMTVTKKAATVVDLFRSLSRVAFGRNDIGAIKCRQVAYSVCFLRGK